MMNNIDADPLVGTLFADRYLINFLVARGGMGNIYQAHDVRRGHIVALKMLRAEFGNDPIVLRRFERESDAVKQLKHPNICQLFDTGCTADNIHYFTMEFLEGQALDSILAQKHTLTPGTAVNYIAQVAAALCDAHNHNIVHRDLKPANIFIVQTNNAPEFVKVLDFGVAKVDDEQLAVQEKLTNAGSTLGTPFYMSPEQIQGLEVDGRTDVYALGIILWECLFGVPPFTGKTLMDIFRATMTQKLPKLPPELRGDALWKAIYAVLKKALEKDRKHRYPSMLEFLRALEVLKGQNGITRVHMSTPKALPTMKFATIIHKISPVKLIIIGAIFCIVVGSIIATICLMIPEEVEIPQIQLNTYRFNADIPATILVNGKVIDGKTPQSLDLELKPPFSVVYMADDAPDFSFRYEMAEDAEASSFFINMKPTPVEEPVIEIITVPSGATVIADGIRASDLTPCEVPVETDGNFHIIVQKEGYKVEDIYVAPNGGNMKIRTNLLKKHDEIPEKDKK